MEAKELFFKVYYWILIAFVIFVIIQVIRKIFGGSWSIEELTFALVAVNVGFSFALLAHIHRVDTKITKHLGWHNGYKNGKRNGK